MAVDTAMRFVPVIGSRLSLAQAQCCGEVLYAMSKKLDGVTASEVLLEARSESSPLHSWFDWDNYTAAESWRLNQAGQLLRSIAYEPLANEDDSPSPRVRFFHVVTESVSDSEEVQEVRRYVPLTLLHAKPDLMEQVLRQCKADLASVRNKYRNLSVLDKVLDWAELDKFLADYQWR